MALLQTVQLEHIPPGYTIHVALFRSLTNASFLHQQLLAGNTDFEYALIDASVIISRLHALSAAYRAVNDLVNARLRSRNVHSEVVFSLSPNNNIAESFRRIGITPTTTSLLAIKISTPTSPTSAADIQTHLTQAFKGEQVAFDDDVLASMTDWAKVRKIYKLNTLAGGAVEKKGGDTVAKEEWEGEERKEWEILVLGSMALRGSSN